MATLHLLHGIVGSGKTTFAQKLERELPAGRFSPDEWMVKLYGNDPPAAIFDAALARVFDLIWEHTGRVLRAGSDVVLDIGLWTRASRDDARRRAAAFGVTCRLYELRCPEEVARRRVRQRTRMMPEGALYISEPTFDVLKSRPEPLEADETHVVVDTGTAPPS
jgi:predicted kinase